MKSEGKEGPSSEVLRVCGLPYKSQLISLYYLLDCLSRGKQQTYKRHQNILLTVLDLFCPHFKLKCQYE